VGGDGWPAHAGRGDPIGSGPGQASDPRAYGEAGATELKKRLVRNKLGGRIVGIETIDRMTDRQIAAKVRRYFKEKSTRQ